MTVRRTLALLWVAIFSASGVLAADKSASEWFDQGLDQLTDQKPAEAAAPLGKACRLEPRLAVWKYMAPNDVIDGPGGYAVGQISFRCLAAGQWWPPINLTNTTGATRRSCSPKAEPGVRQFVVPPSGGLLDSRGEGLCDRLKAVQRTV